MSTGFAPVVPGWIVRRHLAYLRLAGMTWGDIADRSGLPAGRLRTFNTNDSDMERAAAYSILAVKAPLRRADWMQHGECGRTWVADLALSLGIDKPVEMFLAGGRRSEDLVAQHAALTVCNRCTVRTECLDFAVDGDERGIWGGTTERDRARMRKDHR